MEKKKRIYIGRNACSIVSIKKRAMNLCVGYDLILIFVKRVERMGSEKTGHSVNSHDQHCAVRVMNDCYEVSFWQVVDQEI